MATESTFSGDDPRRLLSRARELARRVRADQRATWFPLLVLAAVIFAAIPVTLFAPHSLVGCHPQGPPPGGGPCFVVKTVTVVYWPIALILAYLAIAAFYIRRSAARGIGTRVRPYVIAGIILALAMTAALLWEVSDPRLVAVNYGLFGVPLLVVTSVVSSYAYGIGAALLILAWAERNVALLALTAGYLVMVVISMNIAWHAHNPHEWAPAVFYQALPATVLALGGIGFLLAQRPWRRAA